jgi:hypothetical protein
MAAMTGKLHALEKWSRRAKSALKLHLARIKEYHLNIDSDADTNHDIIRPRLSTQRCQG